MAITHRASSAARPGHYATFSTPHLPHSGRTTTGAGRPASSSSRSLPTGRPPAATGDPRCYSSRRRRRSGPTQAGSVFVRTAHTRGPAWGQAPGQGPLQPASGKGNARMREYPSPNPPTLVPVCCVFSRGFHASVTVAAAAASNLDRRHIWERSRSAAGSGWCGGTLRDRRSGHAQAVATILIGSAVAVYIAGSGCAGGLLAEGSGPTRGPERSAASRR